MLEATDPDNDTITIRFPVYETESKTLLNIRQTTNEPGIAKAELVLKTELDRDYVSCRNYLQLIHIDSYPYDSNYPLKSKKVWNTLESQGGQRTSQSRDFFHKMNTHI